ncbi:ABC transporter permease [Vagococcus bubulae]|nr:ABC transporter permease [Vagococcus bubulae]
MIILKRSIQSLKKLKKRTSILFLLFLIVVICLISGSVIKNSLQDMLNSAKKEVNPIATIETDLDSLMKDMMTGGQNSTSKPIDDELVEKVKKSDYVKEFSAYGSADVSTQYSEVASHNNTGSQDYIEPTNTIEILDSQNRPISRADTELVKGRYVTEEDNNKVIVSEEYANEEDLDIGDSLSLLTDYGLYDADKTLVEIVGIYKLSDNNSDVQKRLENQTFYSNRKLVSAIKKIQFQGDTSSNLANYSKIKVNLKDPMDTELFFSELQDGKDYEGIKFSSSYEQYQAMSHIVDGISKTFSVIQVVVFFVASIIMALIMLMSLRERRYEIGLLRSLGENKKNVLIQMFIEVFMIFIVSFLIGLAFAKYVVTPNMSTMINEKLDESMSESISETTVPFKGPNFEEDTDSELSVEPKIDSQTRKISTSSISIIFVTLTGIICLSTVLPTYSIVKKSPKQILSTTD